MAWNELVSERTLGILAVSAGAAMLILSVFDVYQMEFQGSLCLTGGAILWYRGTHKARIQRTIAASVGALEGHESEVDERLADGTSLDVIVSDFHARYGVPAEAMLLVLTMRLRAWLDRGTPEEKVKAADIVGGQRRHASPGPLDVLNRLHEPGVGIYRDNTALAGAQPPSLAAGQRGTLVLTPHYLFFIPMTAEESDRKDFSTGALAIDVIPMAAEAFSIVRAGYRNPFTPKDTRTLRAGFTRDGSFALPLGRTTALRLTSTFAPTFCVDLEWRDERGDAHRRWLDTTLRQESSDAEPQPQTWAHRWIDRLRCIALAEGTDLPAPPEKTTSVALVRGHGHPAPAGPPPLPPAEQSRVLKTIGLTVALLFGLWALAIVMILRGNNWGLAVLLVSIVQFFVLGAYAPIRSTEARRRARTVMGRAGGVFFGLGGLGAVIVENGSFWGLSLFFAGIVLACFLVFFGFRRILRDDEAQRPRDPTVTELLESPGGLMRLAQTPRTPFEVPAVRIRMAAASTLVLAAQSGVPAMRQWADRAAANQAGTPLAEPAEALRTFSHGDLFFPGETAVRDPSSASVAGALFVSAQYLFFLAGATAPTGTSLDAASVSRLEVALSHDRSLAVPVRDMRAIELGEGADPTMRLTVEQDGAPHDVEFRVGDGGTSEKNAVRAGFWMTRIQWAAAAEGNLLRWEEDQRRLGRTV